MFQIAAGSAIVLVLRAARGRFPADKAEGLSHHLRLQAPTCIPLTIPVDVCATSQSYSKVTSFEMSAYPGEGPLLLIFYQLFRSML